MLDGSPFPFLTIVSILHSSTLTDEKTKVEESVRKGKELYEESHQRAVAAEVSPGRERGAAGRECLRSASVGVR